MPSSMCCFLTCIQISQEAGKVVWYSHVYKNFPQFVGVVNKAEVDVFLEMIQQMLAIWSLVPLPFLIQLEYLEVLGSYTIEPP